MFKSIFSSGLAISLLIGCTGLSSETETVSKKVSAEIERVSKKLEDREWKLISFGESRMAVSSRVTLLLKNGHYSGNAGCNAMSGKYTLRGDSLIFGGKAGLKGGISTMMACPDMALETKYHEAMEKVNRYKVESNRLILLHGDHSVLNFVAK